ncbi:right-handed parallel beta-helix repeat-containing protein [Metabacillus rhizolycopersici]|uniref:Right-handed parallel beta-helix repeat-containing protein n=1 Tax=Metabacillus rhizolycopersici TaxID=2875709 RepID=A0ABS7UN04_9BACI|nr:right-handed parallel beta-helix repeat-containing protein [Metabacillus rhizolycopersici]MBZ5749690.1 right-handed parallel beta-helix repeat-containing protein [Metabacillus rhizolycopersici]
MVSSNATYVVELDRWGIKNDGTDALNTTNGINSAFLWARDNNLYTVVLPKGQYLIDKNSSVLLQSNTHYKFYDCLFIKESNNLTVYSILTCDGIKNVTIEGATVKGDRETHNYSSGGTHEWGHGIECKNSCYNISIKDCEAYECTGDGFVTSMDFSAIGGAQHPAHFAKGDINSQGNIDNTKTNYTTVSKYFDITGNLVKSVGYFYYAGDGYGGYGTGSNLNKTVIKVHFYKSDDTYLGFRNTRSYEFIYLDSLPVGTAKVRFSFLQNYDLMSGNLHYVMCAKIPQYINFSNCKSHKNRRLGASINGGRFVTFDSCEIYNNSNPLSKSSGTNPGYGIDVEDGYMTNQKITIRNCNIYDNRAGAFVCVSTRGVHVENNKFRGLFVFSGSGDDYFSLNNMYYGGISGRSITSGVEVDGTFCTFRNDSVFGESVSILAGNTTLENCVFSKSSLSLGGETAKVINCKLTFDDPDKNAAFGFSGKNVEIYNSLFDIRRSKGTSSASYNSSENVILSNVKFITRETSGGHYVGTKNLIVNKCEFNHSGNTTNYSRMMVSESMKVEDSIFKNQSFRFDGGDINGTEKLANETGYITHSFKNNKIIWDAPNSTYTHEARGPGIAFLYIPRVEIFNNIFHVIDKGISIGSLYTLRIFTENHLNLSNNTILTTKTSNTNTKGTITIEGAYRKSGSTIVIPKTTIVDQNNIKINSDIIYTNNVKDQL